MALLDFCREALKRPVRLVVGLLGLMFAYRLALFLFFPEWDDSVHGVLYNDPL